MKDWCKIFQFEEFDALVTKDYDEVDGREVMKISVYDDESGILAEFAYKFKSKEKRNLMFQESTPEKIKEIAVEIIHAAQ